MPYTFLRVIADVLVDGGIWWDEGKFLSFCPLLHFPHSPLNPNLGIDSTAILCIKYTTFSSFSSSLSTYLIYLSSHWSLFERIYLFLHVGARIAQWYSAGLRAGWPGVWIQGETGNFSVHYRVQTGSGANPASYWMDTTGKAAGGWSWPLTSIHCRCQECVELYLHFPTTPSWCDAQLKYRDKFTCTCLFLWVIFSCMGSSVLLISNNYYIYVLYLCLYSSWFWSLSTFSFL
jgi:hypothetical protein